MYPPHPQKLTRTHTHIITSCKPTKPHTQKHPHDSFKFVKHIRATQLFIILLWYLCNVYRVCPDTFHTSHYTPSPCCHRPGNDHQRTCNNFKDEHRAVFAVLCSHCLTVSGHTLLGETTWCILYITSPHNNPPRPENSINAGLGTAVWASWREYFGLRVRFYMILLRSKPQRL